MEKYKFTWKDLSLNDFKVYFFSLFKAFIPKKKIKNFDELEEFMKSVNLAKWNIYAVSLQDLTFFSFSYLKVHFNFEEMDKAKEIFLKILDDETSNNMPLDIIEEAKKSFNKRLEKINWENYYSDIPFNQSALSLHKWAPIADELKLLDRKIVLNSSILKWDVIKKEFMERIEF